MIVNKFTATFSNDEKTTSSKALLKYINKSAPKGYKYELLYPESHTYSLRKDKDDSTTFLIRLDFPMTFEGINVKNPQDLLELSYRVQKPIILDQTLQKGKNGQPPTLFSLTGEISKQSIVPSPFPKLKPLKVHWGNKSLDVPFKRIPFPSLSESRFESVGDSILDISLSINETTDETQIKTNINFNYLKTIDDYFKFRDFLENYSKGKVSLFSGHIKLKTEDDSEKKKVFKENDKLYSALHLIGKRLDSTIPFPQKITERDINKIKILFESYINNRIVKFKSQPNLKFTFNDNSNFSQIAPTLGKKNVRILVPLQKEIEFLTLSLQVIENQLYTNTTVKEIDLQNNTLVLEPNELDESFVYYQDPADSKEITFNDMLTKTTDAIDLDAVDFSILK